MTDSYACLMLDYCSGALPAAPSLLVQAHLHLRPEARDSVQMLDALGGRLLESASCESMRSGPPVWMGADVACDEGKDYSQSLDRVLRAASAEKLAFRWRAPGLREDSLPLEGARLLKIPSGRSMPHHGHSAEELTLVLRGAFADDRGVYGPGDIAFADESVEHAPRVVGSADCVCLVAMRGDFRFRSLMGRVAARLFS